MLITVSITIQYYQQQVHLLLFRSSQGRKQGSFWWKRRFLADCWCYHSLLQAKLEFLTVELNDQVWIVETAGQEIVQRLW